MNADKVLAEQSEANPTRLWAVAYRMHGSVNEADDAVQEGWLRLGRSDTSGVENLRDSLTTVVARVCLDMLRSRSARREDPLDAHGPDPIIAHEDAGHLEGEAFVTPTDGATVAVSIMTLRRPKAIRPAECGSTTWEPSGRIQQERVGMLKLQLGVRIEEALAQLRASAYSEQRPIDKIAADVVERRRRFSQEDT